MKGLYFVFILFTSSNCFGQNNNNHIEVVGNIPLNFSLQTPQDMETNQVLPNAILLKVKTKNKACSVYAKLSSWTFPSGYITQGNPIAMQWVSDNSDKDYNLILGLIDLTTTDKLLFTQNKYSGNNYLDFYYNLTLIAPGYNFVPGTYSFSILYTMTQQ